MGLMAVTLVFPLLVARAAGADAALQARFLQLSMLAMGVATLLQAFGRGLTGLPRIGSGFLLPAVFTAAYLPPSLAAAHAGGLGAVAGLTIAGGLAEIVLSRFIGRLRPYLPVEIVGLAVVMIGIILGIVALKLMLGYDRATPLAPDETGAALLALAVMVALSVWGGTRGRSLAVLAGLVAGAALYAGYAVVAGAPMMETSLMAPQMLVWPLAAPRLDVWLLPGFLAGALACTLRAFGDMVACQKINDAAWKRPDYANVEAGILADGLGTLIAGLIGTMGLNTYSASVGLSVATGILARRVALGVAAGWFLLAFFPGSANLLLAIPQSVLGAALLFASTFVALSGIAIIGQRVLDSRRTLSVGLGFFLGLSFDEMPRLYVEHLPALLQPLITSSLVLALATGLALNALFRIHARKVHRFAWTIDTGVAPLRQFLLDVGGREGVRAETVLRLSQLAEEFADAAPFLAPGGRVDIIAALDEYAADLTFEWTGRPLATARPVSLADDVDEDEVMSGVALALMRRLADRLTPRSLGDGRHALACRIDT